MNHKGAGFVGIGQTEMTTISFVRSLVAWQDVMFAAVAGPQPFGLFSAVDLVAAATNLAKAREWVEFLDTIHSANAEIVAEGERRGASDYELAKFRMIASYAGTARKHAQDHVQQLSRGERRR